MLSLRETGRRRRAIERIGLYARYGTQAAVVASLTFGTMFATVSALLAASGIGLWLTLGFLFFPAYFIDVGISGSIIAAFFGFFAASGVLLRAANYVVTPKQPGHFLNPISPFRAEFLPEEQTLVRAASADDAALLRPVAPPAQDAAPRELLRAVNSDTVE